MTIEERLEVVERELAPSRRRTRRMWVALGLAGAVCAIVWSLTTTTGSAQAQCTSGKVIRANKFIVEDENGKNRAILCADTEGAGLWLSDENGKYCAELIALKNGSSRLSLSDKNGKALTELLARKDGTELWLKDDFGIPRAVLAATKDGSGLVLLDKYGKVTRNIF
jgi:hypothetical protein